MSVNRGKRMFPGYKGTCGPSSLMHVSVWGQVFLPQIYKQFTNYKHRVPTYGAILLNKGMNKALMVKGYRQGASWGFPKGK
eukprot:scaffold8004_cov417-Prasinococcus_capsulatus_cf.AAC.1